MDNSTTESKSVSRSKELEQYFPNIDCAIRPIHRPGKVLPVTQDSIPEEEIAMLLKEYRSLGQSTDEQKDMEILIQLCFNMRLDAYIGSVYGFDLIRDNAIQDDLQSLYSTCTNPQALSGAIEISSRNSTIKLENRFNWVQDMMIRGFLKEHPVDTEAYTGHTAASDERADIIIKGIYQLVNDSHSFQTPIPDSLCSFILFYLGLCGIVPSSLDIGFQWIKERLRTLNTNQA